MKVRIDKHAGFCFGVKNAVSIAESMLEEHEGIFCLGELVHNEEEMYRLQKLGLSTIDSEQYKILENTKVLIRAHGEPPSTYVHADLKSIYLIDATCPIVKHLQGVIGKCYEQLNEKTGQIVIFGKPLHPETISLLGQTNNTAVVLTGEHDIAKIDPARDVYLFSQTTMNPNIYQKLSTSIKEYLADGKELFVHNTICRQMTRREENLKRFAASNDVVVFVSGSNSSNGKYLFELCGQANKNSYLLTHNNDIDPEWFRNAQTIGVSGAASTSVQQLKLVAAYIRKL